MSSTLDPRQASGPGAFERLFLCYSFVVLGLTGAAKLASCLGFDPILFRPDPVVHILNIHLLLMTGVWELAVASVLWANIGSFSKSYAVWLTAGGMLLYRLGHKGVAAPCPCLGSLVNAVPVSGRTVDLLLTAIAATLFVGSGLAMLHTVFRRVETQ
jgi:hypothetical protein